MLVIFRDMMEVVLESGPPQAPLHLRVKVFAYHGDRVRAGDALPPELLDLKTVLMPRQWFLKKLDSDGDLTVPKLRRMLEPHMIEYRALVKLDHLTPRTTVKKALSIYKVFHLLTRQPSWGRIPFGCSCTVCFQHCI